MEVNDLMRISRVNQCSVAIRYVNDFDAFEFTFQKYRRGKIICDSKFSITNTLIDHIGADPVEWNINRAIYELNARSEEAEDE